MKEYGGTQRYVPEREILSGVGPLLVKQPRVDDRKLRRHKEGEPFTARILPRYLRRLPSIDNLIPALYLKGISTGDFPRALSSIPGSSVKGLSSTNIIRLKRIREEEYRLWSKRDLSDKEYVYFRADGIYFTVRLDDERLCMLVIVGADKAGNKELVAINDGYRESTISWKETLLDLKRRGLRHGPRLSIADGGLGYWAALAEVFPESREQRCWVHIRTTNPIESTVATVRHRTKRTKGCGSRMVTLTMVFKLAQEAQKTWKKLKGYNP